MLDDKNVGGVYGLPRIILQWMLGVLLPGAVSCDPAVVEIRTVVRRLFLSLSALRDRGHGPGSVLPGVSSSSASGSMSNPVSSDPCEFWYSSLLPSLR